MLASEGDFGALAATRLEDLVLFIGEPLDEYLISGGEHRDRALGENE